MKTIGILGGTSWESTVEYYRILNHKVSKALGGLSSASLLIYSFNFAPLEKLMSGDKWNELAELMIQKARILEKGGAECLVLASNTVHQVADQVKAEINIPLLHIADATAKKALDLKVKNLGLLGTKFTMEKEFYKQKLTNEYGLNVVIPNSHDRQIVHDVIFNELCRGKLSDSSRKEYIRVVSEMAEQNVQAVALGCTEIPLLLKPSDSVLPLLDTTELHAQMALDFALSD